MMFVHISKSRLRLSKKPRSSKKSRSSKNQKKPRLRFRLRISFLKKQSKNSAPSKHPRSVSSGTQILHQRNILPYCHISNGFWFLTGNLWKRNKNSASPLYVSFQIPLPSYQGLKEPNVLSEKSARNLLSLADSRLVQRFLLPNPLPFAKPAYLQMN